MRIARRCSMVFVYGLLVCLARFALAQDRTGESDARSEAPVSTAEQQTRAAWAAAGTAMVHGPQTIAFRDQAKLELPAGYGFAR